MPYPLDTPTNKHDLRGPHGLPPPDESLTASDLHFDTTPALFQALKQDVEVQDLKQLTAVYSFSDAPDPPLSRVLPLLGFCQTSLSCIRKLVGDDNDDDDDGGDIPDCLTKCTLAVKRGDGKFMSKLDSRHQSNSKTFAQLMQRLIQDDCVAILGRDKLNRMGILKPVNSSHENGGGKYKERDFYCRCYTGEVSKIKQFLTQGMAPPRPPKLPASAARTKQPSSPTWKPSDNGDGDDDDDDVDDTPKWKPPKENHHDTPTWKPDGDDMHGGGGLWQPPGFSDTTATANNDDTGGGLWLPPGAGDDDGGGGGGTTTDFSSWQPPSDDGAFHSNTNTTNAWENNHSKRKGTEMDAEKSNVGSGDQFHANKGAAAADAFYSGLTRRMDTRADSYLYHMRLFNGWVKATQIQELNPQSFNPDTKRQGSGPMRVLDLACGKGGDLGKWILHPRGVSEYVGSDVARGSLKDAAIRARALRNRGLKYCTFTCADLGEDVPGRLRSPKQHLMQKLLTWSLQDEPSHCTGEPDFKEVRGGGIRPDQRFDVVSIQFAIHYLFGTKVRARRFFHTVSQLLEVGGNLIATTIDSRMLIAHLLNCGRDMHFDDENDVSNMEPFEIRVGGGACLFRIEPEMVKKMLRAKTLDDLMGLEYTFILAEGSDHEAGVGDAVNLPEWMAPIPALKSLAEEVGLEMDYAQNFHEYWAARKDPTAHAAIHGTLQDMKVMNHNGTISPDEWAISRMYMAVKFRKVREPHSEWDDDDEQMEEEDVNDLDPKVKMKLMPMAMMKAKRAAGEVWEELTMEEKTQRTEAELIKLAKQQS